jgi:Protein of unknown function (DUF2281)
MKGKVVLANFPFKVNQMSEKISLEQAVLDNLRVLPNDKQQEVLDFVEFLVQKIVTTNQLYGQDPNSSISSTPQQTKLPSLQEIAKLPVAQRHELISPFIKATAEDFLNEPELTEFSVLDGEDWETE